MADVSKLKIGDSTYNIKDAMARSELSTLGDLAFQDDASGSFTPSGSVAAPVITIEDTYDSGTETLTLSASSNAPAFTGTPGTVTVS